MVTLKDHTTKSHSLIKISTWCKSMPQQRDAAGWHGAISTSTQYSVPNSHAPVSVTVNLYGVSSSYWLHLPNGKPFKAFELGR